MSKSKNLIVEIEALHNRITGNHVLYTDEALSDFDSWVSPYKKPAILHHKDEDGKIVGRVLEAKKIASTLKPGLNALWLKARITDAEMIEGIKNGTYLTTSVGAKGTHVECSICGHRIDSGYACQHKKGKIYKGQACHWIVKRMTAKEISFVIVPSDKYSQIIKFYDEPEEQPVSQNSKGDENQMELQEALEKIKSLETAQTELMAELAAKQTSLQECQEQLSTEMALREGLEAELGAVRLTEKQNDIQAILALREQMGMRPLESSFFEAKSETYLKEALEDLNSELHFRESLEPEVPETELKEQIKTDITKLQESQKVTNTDVPLEKPVSKKCDIKSIVNNVLG